MLDDPRTWVSAAVLAAGLALALAAAKSDRFANDEGPTAVGVLLLFLALLVWVPRSVRDPLLGLLLGVSMAAVTREHRLLLALVMGGGLYGLSFVVPGGAGPLVFGLMALIGSNTVRDARRHVARIAAADRLSPGRPVRGPVQIGGALEGAGVAGPPTCPERVGAYQIPLSSGAVLSEPPVVTLRTPLGPVEVHTAGVRFDVRQDRQKSAEGSEELARFVAATHGDPVGNVSWLEPGAEVCVVGLPDWKAAPSGRGYRDGGHIPVFGLPAPALSDPAVAAQGRAWAMDGEDPAVEADAPAPQPPAPEVSEAPEAWLADVPLARMVSRARWFVLAWGVAIPVVLALGVAQVAGYLE